MDEAFLDLVTKKKMFRCDGKSHSSVANSSMVLKPISTVPFHSYYRVHNLRCHYENMPMQYMEIFSAVKIKIFDIFFIFAQNIDCGYTLEPPPRGGVLTSTHNLCFGSKIRKIGIPRQTPVLLYKSGV